MQMGDVRVLVVDDVNAMRVQFKELLKSSGFKNVTVAPNGEEAKRTLEMDQYHLILADWHMEPTSGLDFLKYVRSHPDYKGVVFIMITAENAKEMVVQAVQSGVDDYLVKPLTPDQIKGKVQGVLTKKKVLT